MGIDPTIVLVRDKSRSISVNGAGGSLLYNRPTTQSKYVKRASEITGEYLVAVAVVFCGKIYRGVLAPIERIEGITFEGIWAAEKLRAWAEKKKIKVEMSAPFGLKERMKIDEYFIPQETSGKLREYMILNKVSILTEEDENGLRAQDHAFSVNPSDLKRFGFAKAVDPFTAFQELSMWIGGVLGGTSPEICHIKDDKVLIENHGYDKYSFRSQKRPA